MNQLKKITILMTTYNGEKYLEEQIESLINQEEVIINILVRDDGSTDNTKEILEKYQKKGYLKWYTGKRLGPANGFMDLMYNVKEESDYYAFCDQDDVWDKDKLKIAISQLENFDNKKPSIYYCGQRLVDENLKLLSIHKMNTHKSLNALFIINSMAGCTAVFNKRLLQKIKEHKVKILSMHDNWIIKVCISLGGNVFIDENPHINYRQHSNNAVGLKSDLKNKIRRAIEIIFNKHEKKNIELLYSLYQYEMINEYKELSKMIINYDKSLKNWIRLLKNKKIDFGDKGLMLTYKLKVILFKL